MKKHSLSLYGGAFDPPHLGHGMIIKKISEVSERTLVVPLIDRLNERKNNKYPFIFRCQLLEALFEDLEINAEIFKGEYEWGLSGYTIHLLERIYEEFKLKPSFFMGSDQFDTFNEWVGFPKILLFADFYIITRKNHPIHWHDGILHLKDKVTVLSWDIPEVSSSEIKQNNELYSKYLTNNVKKLIKAP